MANDRTYKLVRREKISPSFFLMTIQFYLARVLYQEVKWLPPNDEMEIFINSEMSTRMAQSHSVKTIKLID